MCWNDISNPQTQAVERFRIFACQKDERVGLLYVRGKLTNSSTPANTGLTNLPGTESSLQESLATVLMHTLLSVDKKRKCWEIGPLSALSNNFHDKDDTLWVCLTTQKIHYNHTPYLPLCCSQTQNLLHRTQVYQPRSGESVFV